VVSLKDPADAAASELGADLIDPLVYDRKVRQTDGRAGLPVIARLGRGARGLRRLLFILFYSSHIAISYSTSFLA
jgi:hypothetical protein